MKLADRYRKLKAKYPNYIIFIKSGVFYNTYGDDAILINQLFGYKIVKEKVGFPIRNIDKMNRIDKYLLVDRYSVR